MPYLQTQPRSKGARVATTKGNHRVAVRGVVQFAHMVDQVRVVGERLLAGQVLEVFRGQVCERL